MVRSSIQEYLKKLPSALKKDLDRNLCTCMDVPKINIIRAIVHGADSIEKIKKQTSATMGSGCCTQQIERLIDCLCKPKRRHNSRPVFLKNKK